MRNILKLIVLLLLFCHHIFALDISDSLIINGYGNLSTYTTNKNDPQEKELELNLGFQGRYTLSDRLSATAQIGLSSEDTTKSLNSYDFEKKWLYLDYYLGSDATFRAGLFQLPIFQSLEMGDIGYAKTWTDDPLGIYGVHGYDNFTGVELLKNFFYDDKQYSIQFSYGQADAQLGNLPNRILYEKAETNNLSVLTLKVIDDNYKINLGYLRATSDLEQINKNNGNVKQLGKSKLEMLALESQFDIDDFTIKAGIISGDISNMLPDEFRYYTSLEYNFNQFTPYIYYSNEKLTNKMTNPLPPAPPISRVESENKTYSLGLRYDLNPYTALKFSFSKKTQTIIDKNIITNNTNTISNNRNTFRLVLNVIF